jgi:hypothetical protein
MANILANVNGNWSSTGSWIGGVVPTTGDVAYLNNKTIVADVNITCTTISSRAENGATAGGSLTVSTNRTINANIYAGLSTIISVNVTGITVNINGTLEGGNGASQNCRCVIQNVQSTVNITGNCYGGSGTVNNDPVRNNFATAVTNVVGDCYPSASNSAVVNVLMGTVNITGNCYGNVINSAQAAVLNNANGFIYITGNAFGGDGSAGGANTVAVWNGSTGLIELIGTAKGGAQGSAGAYNNSTGTLRVKRAKGNDGGIGQIAPTTTYGPGVINLLTTGLCYAEEIEYGSRGATPVVGAFRFKNVVTNTCTVTTVSGGTKVLSDPNNTTGLVPADTDVRYGVVYANGVNTGSCYVPSSGSVVAGVPVDNTLGTAVLTIDSIANVVAQIMADALSDPS